MIGEGSELPPGIPVKADVDAADVDPVDVLSPEESVEAAASRGLAVITTRRFGKFKKIGEQIRDAGALSVSRGMIAVGIEDCFKADKEIAKLLKKHDHDLDAQLKLLSLKKDFLTIRSKMSSDMSALGKVAVGELSQEEREQAKSKPVLGDVGALLNAGAQVTLSERSVTVQNP